jgi:biotin synthase
MEKETFTSEHIMQFLQSRGEEQRKLHNKAASVRDKVVSKSVFFRGIIEFSNACSNDCFYCGIRKSNTKLKRYSMSQNEIMDSADFCSRANYGSIVLQSGEVRIQKFVDFVEEAVRKIKAKYPNLGITLCVGEQEKETYKRFFKAGAHRYLLRIETTNQKHYEKLHPKDMSFQNRKKCLSNLKEIGYQVGTGVMIGSPFQKIENLVNDLLFFKKIDIDMVGMGPFVPCDGAPIETSGFNAENNLNLALNMIAVLRQMMPDINIASTTALQAIDPKGRELGLMAGANVIMPIVTPTKYRENYQLYKDKPCIEESSEECRDCIIRRIESTVLEPCFGKWGDSKHFAKRLKILGAQGRS